MHNLRLRNLPKAEGSTTPLLRHFITPKIILTIFLIYSVTFAQVDTSFNYPPNSTNNIPALNFKDTDIRDVLRSVAYEYQTNIVVDNQVIQKISVTLFNIRVFDAIKVISEDNNLDFAFDNQRFFVRTKKIEQPAPPPPPPEPEPEISFNKGKLNISLDNVDIQKVVNGLRKETKKNFLLTSGTSGRLTGSLTSIELEVGLQNLFRNNGFYLSIKDSIYYITRSSYYSSIDNNDDQNIKSAYWISARNNKVTLDVNNIELNRILDDLSNQLNLQIIKLAAPTGNITLKCSEISLDKAMEYLFKGSDFAFRKDGNAYIIGNKSSKNLDDTRLIRLSYLRASKIKETLPQAVAQNLSISISLEHNALIVTGQNESISGFEDYIATIDRPVPQVMIEALVVDYNLTKQLQYGLSAGKGDSTYTMRANKYNPGVDATISGKRLNEFLNRVGSFEIFGTNIDVAKLGKLPDDFYLNLKALQQNGFANVRSKPILSSLNGHTASLKIGTVQNYVFNEIMPVSNQLSSTFIERERIEKIEANISFEITPWIGPNNELTLEIKPEFQTPIGEFVPDKKLIPAINTRSFFSTVRLRDGETIVLGGLIQETESNSEEKFPILGDIPIIGALFTSVSKNKFQGELVVYITPKIFYGDDFGNVYYDYSR